MIPVVAESSDRGRRDRGAVDVSIEMLFGMVAVLLAFLLVFETTAYWHARNVFDEAAAEGARVAAAFDGTCTAGVAATQHAIIGRAGGWAHDLDVTCADGPVVTVTVRGRTPGLSADVLGARVQVAESAPRER